MNVIRWIWPILLGGIAGCGGDIALGIDWGPLSCHPQTSGGFVEPGLAVMTPGSTIEFLSGYPQAQAFTWRRCAPSGACTEIPGANSAKYTWAGLNLADDGTRIEVTSYGCDVTEVATSQVLVLPAPRWAFEDGEFLAGDWDAELRDELGGPTKVLAARQTAGGNPGAYLELSYDQPPATSSWVFHGASRATYDPAVQGAIEAVDFATQRSIADTYQAGPILYAALRQGARWYIGTWPGLPYYMLLDGSDWTAAFSRSSVDASHFQLVSGAPCGAESCPDFSERGAPITFGFIARMFGESAFRYRAAVDNWRVTVWSR